MIYQSFYLVATTRSGINRLQAVTFWELERPFVEKREKFLCTKGMMRYQVQMPTKAVLLIANEVNDIPSGIAKNVVSPQRPVNKNHAKLYVQ